ncbi:low molecular weight protein-tyrosine-phosphatase [Aquimixticola soesokkakensis]|nr:low molecular weight protein-tyrosine-phosphatase [Aquimixticola soesokkakensis]
MRAVLFVCLGNICRSPTAQVVFEQAIQARGLTMTVASAGTGSWHVGERPYAPMRAAASARGYLMDDLRARQFRRDDFDHFDLILAMDDENLRALEGMRPAACRAELQLLMAYAPQLGVRAVPDPYYTRRFDEAITLIETAVTGLIAALGRDCA